MIFILEMAKLGDEPRYIIYIIDIPNGNDISHTSSYTRVVDPKVMSIVPLTCTRPLANLAILSDNFESSGGLYSKWL